MVRKQTLEIPSSVTRDEKQEAAERETVLRNASIRLELENSLIELGLKRGIALDTI